LVLGFKAEGALLANAVASFCAFVWSVIGLRKQITFGINLVVLKKLLKYSMPLLPHNLSGWAMNMVDRVMLNLMESLSFVALFDVGSQLGKLVNIISLGVNSAFAPWFFEQVKNDENSKTNIARVSERIVILYVAIAICISWLAPELLTLISAPTYYESWKVVPIIAMAFVANGFYFSFSSVFFLEKTKYLPILTLFGAFVNIVLNFFLIKSYGFMGAAYASIITKIFFTSITYFVSQRLFYIPYRIIRIGIWFALGAMACFSPYIYQDWLNQFEFLWVIFLKCVILGIFVGIAIFRNRNSIRLLLQKRQGA